MPCFKYIVSLWVVIACYVLIGFYMVKAIEEVQRVQINIVHGKVALFLKKVAILANQIVYHFKVYSLVYHW